MQAFQGLLQTISDLQTKLQNPSGSQPELQNPSSSQQVAQSTEALSLSCEQPATNESQSTRLFDPSGLLGKKFFTGPPDLICEYLGKYFSQSLDSQTTAEMAKRFKRPDIPVMRVQRLDQFFLKKEHSYMRGRDQTLQEIHHNLLHAVGPIAELLSMLTEGQIPEPGKNVEYISATLVLMGSSAARILTARRKNAICELNPSLASEVGCLPNDKETNLVFGPTNLKSLTELQRDKAQMDKLNDRPAKKPRLSGSTYIYNKSPAPKTNQFFRKGPTAGSGYSGAEQ